MRRGAAVAAFIVVGLSATVPRAGAQQPCTPPQKLGVAFVIDDSGSMASSDPQDFRGQGVGLGLREMGTGRVAALSTFGTSAAGVFAPTELNDQTIPALSSQAVARRKAGGSTSYEAAFTEAKRQLDAMPPGVDRKGVIFLSDGEPTSAYTSDKTLAAAGIPIYPVGFGDAGADELNRIAADSHGIASFVQSPGEVQGAMARAVGHMTCQKVDDPEVVTLPPGGTRDIAFDVPAGTTSFSALASWGGGQISARLIRPDHSQLSPTTKLPGETFDETPTNVRATAQNPKPGRWYVRLIANGTNPESVRVSFDLIGGGAIKHPLTKRPQASGPGCQTEVSVYGRVAWSTCMRTITGGWSSSVPIRVAGLDLEPARGHDVKIFRDGRMRADDARLFVTTSGPLLPAGELTLDRGEIELNLKGSQMVPMAGSRAPKVGGLALDIKAGGELSWTPDGASLKLALDFGREFATILGPEGGIDTASGSAVQKPGAGSATLKRGFGLEVTLATKNDTGLAVDRIYGRVDAGKLYGVLALKNLFLSYEPQKNLWDGGASVVPFGGPLAKYSLPTISAEVALTTNPLSFQKVKLVVSDINKPIGPVFLQKLGGEISRDPLPITIGGEIGLSAGPKIKIPVLGDFTAVEMDGSMSWTYPAHVKASGGLKLVGQGVANQSLDLDVAAGTASVAGEVALEISGNGISGRLDGYIDKGQFQVTGNAQMRVFGKTISGAEAFLSTRGMGACRRGWGPDFGFSEEWSRGFPGGFHGMTSSCDFGSLLYPARSRQAAPLTSQAFTVGAHERGRLVRIHGAGGDPAVVVRGGGREFQIPASSGYAEFPQALVAVRDENNDDLWLVLNAPAAGRWTIDALPGGVAMQPLGTTRALPEPALKTSLQRVRGGRYLLRWRAKSIRGQRLRFTERTAAGGVRTLLATRRSRGRLRFRPAPGPAGVRTIIAAVTQSGHVRTSVQAARFKTRVVRPAAPRRVRVRRLRGRFVAISWRPARAGATAYVVGLSLRDGRRFETTLSRTRRRLIVPAVSRRTHGRVTVRTMSRSGVQSRAAKGRL